MNINSKKIVAIIQARMGSTRLPGKVLMDVNDIPLLEIMLSRVTKSKLLDQVIIATSNHSNDNQIEEFCKKNNYECFRGSENDVLSRYYKCAKQNNADVVVWLTADCPLIDPKIIDSVINYFWEKGVDYAGNTVPPETSTFPDGSDVEVFTIKSLEKAYKEAKDPKDREHVTFYLWKYNHGFTTAQFSQSNDWSKYRFTVDYPEDFEFVKLVYENLYHENPNFGMDDIIKLLKKKPELLDINSKYVGFYNIDASKIW